MISIAFSGFFSTTLIIISVIFFLLASLLLALLIILSATEPLVFSIIFVTNFKSYFEASEFAEQKLIDYSN